jgi:hypothetical protein
MKVILTFIPVFYNFDPYYLFNWKIPGIIKYIVFKKRWV